MRTIAVVDIRPKSARILHMDEEHLQRLMEEIEGKSDLGMGDDALAICRQILESDATLPPEYFSKLIQTIGMFTDNMKEWAGPLKCAYATMDEDSQAEAQSSWCIYLCLADEEWEMIKPTINLRRFSGSDFLCVVNAATLAGDKEWCLKALRIGEEICSQPTALDTHRIALATLQSEEQNHLGAMRSLTGLNVSPIFFETYADVLTKACLGHFLAELNHLKSMVKDVASDAPDPDTELSLPGNDFGRYQELVTKIVRLTGTTQRILDKTIGE